MLNVSDQASILIVDDDARNLLSLEAILDGPDRRLVRASSGEEALRRLLREDFAVILLDVHLGGIDGFETATLIRQRKRSRSIPIIFLTADTRSADSAIKGYALGAVDFLIKPFSPEMLRAKVGVFVDLFRKTAEIKRQSDIFAAVTASMTDGLAIVDRDDRVIAWNPQLEVFFGIRGDQAVGRSVWDVAEQIAPRSADPEGVSRRAREAHETSLAGTPTLFEYRLDSREGEAARDLTTLDFPIRGADGSILGTGLLVRDVTRDREVERLKDELVGVVSHELRTPLASLVGFADLLLSGEFDEDERHQFLNIMVEEGQRLTALINDFLDLQRMESGRYLVIPTTTELPPLLERAVLAAGADPDRPIQLDPAADLPPVRADAGAVLQVLTNLLSNARKYSPNGGPITVSADVVDGVAQVAVSDSGLGLPPEALPRLFEKFYRVDNSDRRAIKGTGLGLAICRKIVDAHGGRIWAESAGLGRGTCVRFTLPLALVGHASGDVLVIEDDPAFAHLLETELVGRGLTCTIATSAEAALEQIVVTRPRAILLDLALPGIQGEDLLRRLRDLGEDIPVVVITARDLDAALRRGLYHLGVVAIHHKSGGVAPLAAGTIDRVIEADGAGTR